MKSHEMPSNNSQGQQEHNTALHRWTDDNTEHRVGRSTCGTARHSTAQRSPTADLAVRCVLQTICICSHLQMGEEAEGWQGHAWQQLLNSPADIGFALINNTPSVMGFESMLQQKALSWLSGESQSLYTIPELLPQEDAHGRSTWQKEDLTAPGYI